MNDFYAQTMLSTRKIQEDTGMTLDQILALPADEYARLTGRPTVGQLAAQVYDDVPGTPRRDAPETSQAAAQPSALASQGVDVSGMDMADYAAMRGQLGMGISRKENRGIFDSVSSRSAEYASAVRVQAGRTGWSTSNVVESPQVNRVYTKPDTHLDTRSAVERFSTPGNSFGA
jgi:hypothetical protein